jgi:VanZ family protein
MAVIFALSAIANPPELPGSGIEHFDKYVHVALYAVLAALFIRARTSGWTRRMTRGVALSAVVFSTLYGVSDEGHQYFVPPRQPDVFDLAADAIGATLSAGVLYAGIIRRRHDL